jgi:FkbM family methyltransferase
MVFAETLRLVFRAIPNVRGKGRAVSLFNRHLLRFGTDPIVECTMHAGHKLKLDLRVPTQMHVYFSGRYNDGLLASVLSYLRPGGVALDVGANIGMLSVPIAIDARAKGARLIAFEAVPSNVEWLRENLELNGCMAWTTIMPIGLSDRPGETEIVLADDFRTGAKIGNAVIADRDFWPQFQRLTIKLDTLDRIWPTIGERIDIIKLDIEGHEHRFLKGARDVLEAHRPAILIESNRAHYSRQGLDFDALIPSLLPAGYTIAEDDGADVLFISR